MRWLIPIPAFPAITLGSQPPDGVTETTQPSASAASTEVVPEKKGPEKGDSSRVEEAASRRERWTAGSGAASRRAGAVLHLSKRLLNGFSSPWNG